MLHRVCLSCWPHSSIAGHPWHIDPEDNDDIECMRIRNSTDRLGGGKNVRAREGTPKDTMHQGTGQQTAWGEGRAAREERLSVGHQLVWLKPHMHHKIIILKEVKIILATESDLTLTLA